jgi:hypothetical protein
MAQGAEADDTYRDDGLRGTIVVRRSIFLKPKAWESQRGARSDGVYVGTRTSVRGSNRSKAEESNLRQSFDA